MNRGPRHFLADILYDSIEALAGNEARRTWRAHTDHLVYRVREAVRRDPGRRVLVVVNVRHCHHIRRALGKHPEIELVPYNRLEAK